MLATGVAARGLSIPGAKHAKVLSYIDVIKSKAPVGQRVAIIGAGIISSELVSFLSSYHKLRLHRRFTAVSPPPPPSWVYVGGIGFDVAELLSHSETAHSSTNVDEFLSE